MKIKAIESTRSPQGRVRLCFDNGKTMMVLPSVVADLSLYPGLELSGAAFASLEDSCAEASAKDRAVRIISAVPVTKKELEHRLIQKGEREEHAKAAVEWLDDLHLLNDAQVAESIVRSGAARGYGASRIRQMLYEKRVPKELWDAALEKLPPQDDAMDSYLQKRFRGKKPDDAERRRAANALARRGHSWSNIRAALERYAPSEDFTED